MDKIQFTENQLLLMTKEQAEKQIPFMHVSECGCTTFNLWVGSPHYAKECANRGKKLGA
jgi:hypothetical protein